MKPADLILQVRRRPEWEAIDLGFILARTLWRSIWPSWLILLGSVYMLCVLLTPRDYVWVAAIVIWWLKPLYDRVLLHILSQQIFDRQPSIAEVFSALPGLISNTGLFSALSWRRFSSSRSYNLPIWQLEGLSGDARKQRQQLLYQQGHSEAIGATIVCFFFKLIIIASIYALIVMLAPGEQAWEHLKSLVMESSGSDLEYPLALLDLTIWTFAIFITEPLFTAAGFTLYLNRRTQLEAWDIEIAFRSMGERLQQLAAKTAGIGMSLLLGTILTLGSTQFLLPQNALAADTESETVPEISEFLHDERLSVTEAENQLEQVMQVEELSDQRQIKTWVPKDKDLQKNKNRDMMEWLEQLIQLLSSIVKYLIWALVFVAVILGVIYRKKIIGLLKPPAMPVKKHKQPDILFGLDIRPESLPDDIAGEARALWQKGETRAALSLLYRGTLMKLTRNYDIGINDSHTEGDILRLARPVLDEQRFDYLTRITRSWQTIAYAHRTPSDAEAGALFEEWQAIWSAATHPTESQQQEQPA